MAPAITLSPELTAELQAEYERHCALGWTGTIEEFAALVLDLGMARIVSDEIRSREPDPSAEH